jgi:cobalt/nickel transport system permease protein
VASVLATTSDRASPEQTGSRRPSVIHRLDPRLRVLAAVAFALVTVALSQVPPLVAAVLVALVVMLIGRLPLWHTLKRVMMMDGFIIVMLLMLPFTVPGDTLFTLWGWPASAQGLRQALVIALKANAVVLCLMALVGTMEPPTLGHALARLKVPERLIHLMLFTIRYIDVIDQEYQRLRIAMKTRGFRPRNSLHTYRSYGYLIGMLLVRALERSERILDAMKCRGFTGRLPLLDTLAFCRRDLVYALIWAGILCALLAAEFLLEGLHVSLT